MSQNGQSGTKQLFCLIALGSNVKGNDNSSVDIIRKAITEISKSIGKVMVASPLYRTPCFPAGAGPDYANAVIRIETHFLPQEILSLLHEIEAAFGRVRDVRWGQRTLDLDLIACDGMVLPDERTQRFWMDLPMSDQMQKAPDTLVLPHPRVQDRAFVLVPLGDVAPEWQHPVLGQSVREMLEQLSDAEKAEVRPI